MNRKWVRRGLGEFMMGCGGFFVSFLREAGGRRSLCFVDVLFRYQQTWRHPEISYPTFN